MAISLQVLWLSLSLSGVLIEPLLSSNGINYPELQTAVLPKPKHVYLLPTSTSSLPPPPPLHQPLSSLVPQTPLLLSITL